MRRKIDRLLEYLAHKGISENRATVDCELSKGLLYQAKSGKADIGGKAIEKILKCYTDLSRVWLLTGEGQMLTESPMSLPDPEPTPISDIAMMNRLLLLLEEKERSHAALLEILKDKDETIRQLAVEVAALKEKRGDAKNVIISSDVNVG